MSKYYIDLEFIESGPENPLQLISIGIVDDEDNEYYAVSRDFDKNLASDWVKKNILSQLHIPEKKRKSNKQISKDILKFVGNDKNPQFIGYYCDYDWVIFCQLFGTMEDLPENFPMYMYDLKQMAADLGNPELPKQNTKIEHNALFDARYNKKLHDFLIKTKFLGRKKFNLKNFQKMLEEKK